MCTPECAKSHLMPSTFLSACSMCNYPMSSGKTLVVKDAANDQSFLWLYKAAGIRSYVGAPLVDASGLTLANLCCFDNNARYDFTEAHQQQFESYASMLLAELQNWSMRNKMEELEKERRTLVARVKSEKCSPPTGKAALVRTSVQI